MKKLFLTLAAIFAISTFAGAQLYLGGGIGFGTTGGSSKAPDGTETEAIGTTRFNLTPRIGYFMDDNLSIGASLDINYLKRPGTLVSGAEWESMTTFGISPYVRYAFFTFGKFSVNIEAGINFSLTSVNYKDKPSTHKISATTFGVYAAPVLSYNLTDRITLETSLNFCNLGFSTSSVSQKVEDNKATDTTTSFGLGVDMNDALSLGDSEIINIGFTYKF
jgi:outer membrane protein